jgi:hypothetical protein
VHSRPEWTKEAVNMNNVVTAANFWLGRRASQNYFVEERERNYQMSICEINYGRCKVSFFFFFFITKELYFFFYSK